MFKRLLIEVETIRQRDPAARSRWEVLTCYPGLHALVLHRVAHRLWRGGDALPWLLGLKWLARFTSQFSRWLTGIEIHPGAVVGEQVFIDHGMGIVIGQTAVVGDGCTIYQGVTLGGTSLERGAKRHPTLGKGVVVGAGAKVLGGFTVGDGASIGSNAVVTKAVPPGATAVGIPARIVEGEPQAASEPSPHAFNAYGVRNTDDPVSKALQALADENAAQAAHIKELEKALESRIAALETAQRG